MLGKAKVLFFGLFLLGLSGLIGCASADMDSNSPEALFKYAQSLENDERFEECLSKYEEVKNRFPYNKLATESELRIADVQFKKEAYIAAAGAYNNFRELHPNHPMMAYVTYRLGLSHFNGLPSTIDRDIAGATNAIKEFDRVIEKYPSSEYVKDSQEKRTASYEMLAQKELYIAKFYYTHENYLSALKRFEGLLTKQSSDDVKREAYYGAGVCAIETGERVKGKEYLGTLIQRFPSSGEADKARSALGKYGLL